MIQYLCPTVLVTLLMIPASRQAESEKRCYMCQGNDCSQREPRIMDCTKQKMSVMNLTWRSEDFCNELIAKGAELEDPTKNNRCFSMQWYCEDWGIPSLLYGCAPDTVGDLEFCDFIDKIASEDDCSSGCETRLARKKPSLTQSFWYKRQCVFCQDFDCENWNRMDCNVENITSMDLRGNAKKMWDLLVEGGLESNSEIDYTQCFEMVWDSEENGGRKKSTLWGCAPEMVGEEEYCDYVNKTAMENNYNMLRCRTGQAGETPSLFVPPERRCYMCQHSDCLKPSRIVDCNEEPMDLSYLSKDALLMWNSLDMEAKDYENCFGMVWKDGNDRTTSEPKSLWGCGPFIHLIDYCTFINISLTRRDNYVLLGCHSCRARTEPCFDSLKWTVPSGTSKSTVLDDHTVFCWIISAILLEKNLG